MTEDLNMTGNDYNVALLSFFVTYILFEVPSNIVSPRTETRVSKDRGAVCAY